MIGAIVLAAGRSRRMGRQKLLLRFGSTTVIEHIIGQTLRSKVGQTLVVVSLSDEAVAGRLGPYPVELVANPHPDRGMLSSVRCGLGAVNEAAEAAMILLGDQPGIGREMMNRLIRHYERIREAGQGIAMPVYQGRRGHPLIFSMAYRPEILKQFDEVGLRGLLEAHPQDVAPLEVDDPAVVENMNTPQDYERIVQRLEGRRGVPKENLQD